MYKSNEIQIVPWTYTKCKL